MATSRKKSSPGERSKKRRSNSKRKSADNRSLTERAYEEIKRKIIAAEFSAGQFLHESAICDDLGLGRTPVHQALHLLMLEGLVEIIPRKGVVVRADTLNDLFKVLEVRSVIEGYCAEQAAERATDTERDELKSLIEQAKVALADQDQEAFMQLDKKLHWVITRAASNDIISELVQSMHERMSRIWYLPHWKSRDLEVTQKEHTAVLTAIMKGDKDAAGKHMRAHISSLRRRVIDGLDAGQF